MTALFGRVAAGLSPAELAHVEALLQPGRFDQAQLRIILTGRHGHNPPSVNLAGAGVGRTIPVEEGRASIQSMASEDASDGWAGSDLAELDVAAIRLGVPATKLAEWRDADDLIKLRSSSGAELYPLLQFSAGVPAPGLGAVTAHFPDREEAWAWLAAPNSLLRGERPIDGLHDGHVTDVLRAAAGVLAFV